MRAAKAMHGATQQQSVNHSISQCQLTWGSSQQAHEAAPCSIQQPWLATEHRASKCKVCIIKSWLVLQDDLHGQWPQLLAESTCRCCAVTTAWCTCYANWAGSICCTMQHTELHAPFYP